jgi:hypothetical protein
MRRIPFALGAALALGLMQPHGVEARQDPQPATIRGFVYDSTTHLPLAGARVAIMGVSDLSLFSDTDETGQFELTDVPPGEHWLSFFHPKLQTLGLSPAAQQLDLGPGDVEQVTLAVPSMETAISGWCALEPGFGGTVDVGGIVVDSLTGVPLPSTRVFLKELGRDIHGENGTTRTDTTDAAGRYAFCNLPSREAAEISAVFGKNENDAEPVTLGPDLEGVVHDIWLRLTEAVSIGGVVKDMSTGEPIPGTEVVVVGTGEWGITDNDGKFAFTDIPPGRHILQTDHIAYRPRTDSITVFNRESVGLELLLSSQAIALSPLIVTGRARNGPMGDVRTMGTRFDGMTREEVDAILPRSRDVPSLLRNARMPSFSIREVTYKTGLGWERGVCIEATRRPTRNSFQCNMITVYVNDVELPAADLFLQDMDPNTIDRFQFIPALEAMALYGDRGRYGVLLLYLR